MVYKAVMKKQLLFLILLILCSALIFYFSGIPHFSTGTQWFLIRKLGHSFAYGLFTFFLWKSIPWFGNNVWRKILLCTLIVLTFATLDEIHQSFVPGRHGGFRGVFFDLLGGCTVLSFFAVSTHIRKTELHPYEK